MRKAQERAPGALNVLVLHPVLKHARTASLLLDGATRHSQRQRGTDACVAELQGLIEAASWRPLGPVLTYPLQRLVPATLFGAGQVAAIAAAAEALAKAHPNRPLQAVVVDAQLTPTQQRNLESVLAVPVYDRTQLILHIFGWFTLARTRHATPRHATPHRSISSFVVLPSCVVLCAMVHVVWCGVAAPVLCGVRRAVCSDPRSQ
jgi:hypothetical protein